MLMFICLVVILVAIGVGSWHAADEDLKQLARLRTKKMAAPPSEMEPEENCFADWDQRFAQQHGSGVRVVVTSVESNQSFGGVREGTTFHHTLDHKRAVMLGLLCDCQQCAVEREAKVEYLRY